MKYWKHSKSYPRGLVDSAAVSHAMKYMGAKGKIAPVPYDLVHEDFKGTADKRFTALYIICQQHMHKIG